MMKRTPLLAALGLSLALIAAARAEGTAKPVRVESVHLVDPNQALTLSGTVSARVQADLGFRVGGKIVARRVNVGDQVSAGTVLAALDPADLHLAAEAATSAVAAAAADAARSRAELGRYQSLGRSSPAFVAEELDRRVATAEGAIARLEQARRQLALAQAQESYAVLRADADGVIAALPAEVGQVVTAGQIVATLAHSGQTEVAVEVPESRLASLKQASRIEVTAWSAKRTATPVSAELPVMLGRLRELAAVADPASRTFAARISLDPTDAASLSLGATVTVRVYEHAGPAVAVLPSGALTGDGAVWVLDEATHHASLRRVSIAAYDQQGHVFIGAGLAEGDRVITAGADLVGPDMRLSAWQGASR